MADEPAPSLEPEKKVTMEDATPAPSKLSRDELLRVLKSWWRKDGPHAKVWRDGRGENGSIIIGAKDAFDFAAGHGQWTDQERDYLKSQRRAPIVFNRIGPTVASVCGIEINSRHDITYLPQTSNVMDEQGQMIVKANEVLSAASQDMSEECDAEDHQSEAFHTAIVTGMGWTEARVDYDEEVSGKYIEKMINPLEMAWDYRAKEKNLADKQRVWHLKPMALHEAKSLFPDEDPKMLDASWATEVSSGRSQLDENYQDKDQDIRDEYDPEHEVSILRCQWWEHEPVWIVANPAQPDKPQVMTVEEYGEFRKRWDERKALAQEQITAQLNQVSLSATRGRRKVYREVFIGQNILGTKDAEDKMQYVKPPQFRDGFTFSCITGIPDRNSGHWFGLVAVMRDPQKWANAWLSQTQHILNSTAKGGILAETDAFQDQRQAEQTYAKPDAITWVNPGAIKNGKIMQKPGVGISAGHANLMEFAISSIRDVTGINLEILGLRDANQPGVLEAQRKQAAMTILAPWFDSLRRFRKLVGRVRLYYIQEYLSGPSRMIPIAGEDGYKLMPLIKDKVVGPHSIKISDAPTSPNKKQEQWAVMREMLPVFRDMLTPEGALIVMEHSPLESAVVQAFKDMVKKPPSPEEQAAKALQMRGAQAQIAKDEASAEQSQASAEASRLGGVVDLMQAFVARAEQQSSDMAMRYKAIADFLSEDRERRTPMSPGEEPAIAPVDAGPPMQLPAAGPPPVLPAGPELDIFGAQQPTPGVIS